MIDDLGTLDHVSDGWRIRFERLIGHPPEAVWAALTDPAGTPTWWGELDADLRVGGHYVMTWNEGRAVMRATITAFDPPSLLETAGDEHHGTVRWELTREGTGTRLVFSSTVADGGPEQLAGGLAGWHWHMDALPIALDGGRKPTSMDEWEAQRQRYLALI